MPEPRHALQPVAPLDGNPADHRFPQRDVSHGTPSIPGAGLDSDLLPIYLLRFERPATRRAYSDDISAFFGSEFVTLRMAREVSFVAVNEHILSLQSTGYAPATIRRKVSGIRGFFDWLVALELLDRNPAHRQVVRRVQRTAASDEIFTVLTREQARRLVDATSQFGASGVRDRALILTLIHCALRRSEAAAMDVEHLRTVGPYWVLDLPVAKGGTDQTVKVPARVVEVIDEVKQHYGIHDGPLWRSLSNNSAGRRLSARSIYAIVHRCARAAGLREEIGAHTLRHTACTLAIEGGATPQQVQAHARHKKLETTMLYVHQRDRLRDNASDYINF
jgi:site-specific recombinase XerD